MSHQLKKLNKNEDLGWFEGVIRCEGDVEEEDPSLVRRAWRAQDG